MRPVIWTADRIVDALQRWTVAHGRAPGCRDWEAAGPGHPSYETVRVRFGSLDAARRAAGVSFLRRNMEEATRDDVIAAVYRWRFLHGVLPREDDWPWPTDEWPGRATVRRLFGSWNGAIVASGYRPRAPRQKNQPSAASYRARMSALTKAAA